VASARKNMRGTLVLGLLLVGAGTAIILAPSGSGVAGWLMRLWPVFLICAGVARVMGFAVERKPRSPIGGMLLIIIGVLFFVSRFHTELNALQIYGRYWIVLLGVFAAVELIRFYSHHHTEGPAPRLFTFGKLLVIALIAATGIIANRVASNPSLISALHLRGQLDGLRDALSGNAYAFTDEPVVTVIRPGGKVAVSNTYGSVRVVGGGTPSVRATLIKSVRAWNGQEDARAIADRVKLAVTSDDAGGVIVSTNRDQVNENFKTDIQLEVPSHALVSITGSYGSVSVSNIQANVDVRSSHGQVEAKDIQGDLNVDASYMDVTASNIDGDTVIRGAKQARLSGINGSLNVTANNGQVDLRNVPGRIRVEAPFSRVTATEIGDAEIRTEHSTVDVTHAADLSIVAPNSEVRAKTINGSLRISSSNGNIQVAGVDGDLEIHGDKSSVNAQDIQGSVTVETSYREVSLKNFSESVHVRTSYADVLLVPSSEPVDDIEVENNHGGIKLVLPESSHFQLDAASNNGQINPIGFAGLLSKTRESLVKSLGGDGPTIKLKTSYKSIVIQASGPRQNQTSAVVN
jgi:DUF4097 and DUF4098 domain-containing protein YvlB